MNFSQYTIKEAKTVLDEFKTSAAKGLTNDAALNIRKQSGFNELNGKEVKWWELLARQFKSTFIYLLIVAAILALVLGEFLDGAMIIVFILINSILGFFQEYRSDQTLKLLKKFIVHQARVKRGGKEMLINSRELVPGDIVLVETGDIISADIRFIAEHDLTVNESVLTGESVPIKKISAVLPIETKELYQAMNIGFQGTVVASGDGEGVVINIGHETAMGKIAALTAKTSKVSTFEKGINKFSKFVLELVLITLVIVFIAHLVLKNGQTSIAELALFSIALAVGVIPEALPTVITFSLSRGALRLAKHKVVVKRLSAIEDLGSIEILCSDKTGTLTENNLSVVEVNSDDPKATLWAAILAASFLSEKKKTPNNSFDLAIWEKISMEDKKHLSEYIKLSENPFDPARRRNSVLIEHNETQELIIRGALEAVLPFVKNADGEGKDSFRHWAAQQGLLGRRVIAVAKKTCSINECSVENEERDLTLIGLISFVDPIKQSTKTAVQKAKELGVLVKIITGDSREVAGAVAHQVGIIQTPHEVITGEELELLSSEKQHEAVNKYSVFARVSPEQKYKIIQLLKEQHEVGFLGEGINDAPALKIANVALVVQGAADIAQEAADIVLLKKDLTVIVDGIAEGREVFANTVKYIKATMASSFGNFYALAFGSLLIDFLPMLPIQILLVNLLSDFPMIAIATDSVDKAELRTPRSYDLHDIILVATLLGLTSTVFDFIFFSLFYKQGPAILQTNWFMASILTELIFVFSIRTKLPAWRAKLASKPLIMLTIVAMVTTIIIPFTTFGKEIFKFTTPATNHLVLIISLVGLYFFASEIVKLTYYRLFNKKISF